MNGLNIGIVGGSIAGCSAAILMRRAGHKVTVFERSEGALVGRGGGIGTTPQLFDSLIEQDVIDSEFPHCSVTEMPFTARRSSDDRLGYTPWAMPMAFRTFHWSALWNNLRRRVPDESYRKGVQVVNAVSEDGDTVILELRDGTKERFDLVLFADGYQSLGRRLIFPDAELSYRGYMLWRGLLPEREMKESAPLGSKLPRLSYSNLCGHMVTYFIPDEHGSAKEGDRIFNWAAYVPLSGDALNDFMIDRDGRERTGTIPPGKMRIAEEDRLKQLVCQNLPTYYSDIVNKTQDTYVQLIYTVELDAYYRDRRCLIGDAGMVIQPFTGSGVFKGFNNVKELLGALDSHNNMDEALSQWSEAQVRSGKRLLALGEQMEKPFIWEPLNFADADAETTAAWWKTSVTFPDDFTHEAKSG